MLGCSNKKGNNVHSHIIPQAPVPIKEVFIGYKDECSIENGGDGSNSYDFILKIPGRDYHLQAESLEEKERWMRTLRSVMEVQPTPQEKKCKYQVVRHENEI